jgi:hypothetical protein
LIEKIDCIKKIFLLPATVIKFYAAIAKQYTKANDIDLQIIYKYRVILKPTAQVFIKIFSKKLFRLPGIVNTTKKQYLP